MSMSMSMIYTAQVPKIQADIKSLNDDTITAGVKPKVLRCRRKVKCGTN